MKKALLILVTALALLAVLAVPVLAKGPKGASPGRPKGAPHGRPQGASPGPPEWASAGSPKGVSLGLSDEGSKGPTGPAGNSNVAHLYLHEKDPSTRDIVEDAAWGKMKYNSSGQEFKSVLNGHGLEPGTDYTLIYYPDPWPGEGLICLGTGTANNGGNVHIKKSVDTGDLPAEGDANHPDGAKIWLILSDDLDCDTGVWSAWNPTEYLFEYDLSTFDDTDVD